MEPLPFAAQRCQTARQLSRHGGDFAPRKPEILAQFDWAARSVEPKDRLASVPDNMYVRRAMIVRVNHHP
jgi:hypothetical protein